MNIKPLPIHELHQRALNAAAAEKAATFHLLECLHWIESRQAHLDLGFSTLFDYVHRALSYSESQAYERIAAMRLAFRVTVIAEKLKAGELTLTTIARIAGHARREKLASERVAELAERVAHCSVRETEKVLAAEATVPMPRREVVRPVAAGSFELQLTIDAEFELLLKEARELENDPTLSIAAILKRALKTRIEKQKKARGAVGGSTAVGDPTAVAGGTACPMGGRAPKPGNGNPGAQRVRSTRAVTPATSNVAPQAASSSRYISITIRRKLWARSGGRCEYVDPKSKRRCESRQSIQVDHILPFALDGLSKIENLRHLCKAHNLHVRDSFFKLPNQLPQPTHVKFSQ